MHLLLRGSQVGHQVSFVITPIVDIQQVKAIFVACNRFGDVVTRFINQD